MSITNKQRRVLDFIVTYQDEHGACPSYDDIGDALGVCKSGVARYIECLEDRGYLTRKAHKARSLELTGKAGATLKSREELMAENERLRNALTDVLYRRALGRSAA